MEYKMKKSDALCAFMYRHRDVVQWIVIGGLLLACCYYHAQGYHRPPSRI